MSQKVKPIYYHFECEFADGKPRFGPGNPMEYWEFIKIVEMEFQEKYLDIHEVSHQDGGTKITFRVAFSEGIYGRDHVFKELLQRAGLTQIAVTNPETKDL